MELSDKLDIGVEVEKQDEDKLEGIKQALAVATGGLIIGRTMELIKHFDMTTTKAFDGNFLVFTKLGFSNKESIIAVGIIGGLVLSPVIGQVIVGGFKILKIHGGKCKAKMK